MTDVEYKSEFEYTKDTTYLAITGELWGVFCEDFGENWPRYNGTVLYIEYVNESGQERQYSMGILVVMWAKLLLLDKFNVLRAL